MNKMKKLTCTVLAAISVFGCAATLTACETSHPEVEMKVAFNGKTYTLDYKLYRKRAPHTVEHFLWLAGNGYYDGLCVHNYEESTRMYTGEYSVTDADTTDIVRKDYAATISAYANYGKFPLSVWKDKEKASPLYTLKGEFEENNFRVENGALDETFGSLTMYYYNAPEAFETSVYAVRASEEGEVDKRDYRYNLTTSAFFISLSNSKKTNNNYCTFATLDSDSKEVLEDLQEAIDAYISDNYGENKTEFFESVTSKVFEQDALLQDYDVEQTFNVPKAPIVIKSVKVTKY